MNKSLAFPATLLASALSLPAAAQVAPPVPDALVDTTGLRSQPIFHQAASFSFTSDPVICYSLFDAPPRFKGGEAELKRFLSHNLRFPPALLRAHVEGLTGVRFTVDVNGHIRNPIVYKSLCEPWDNEVLRVVKLLDYRFESATYNGKRVNAPYILVVPFSLK
ncbi:energy transducer TonB [Hymenobacter sp. HSC-4F20]|uniref:energy transducer TonB n=1 Tax=Hymenobacter sp. HSC-4F20 TaxID=2864135 RepID=UPI001C73447D|nr:energy transducer TonB [Hymenobacter sp. HSC-4F20]MBX0291624.1 energy transducer TonB [Hymenobacter sp. HSC-4F20]